MFWPHACEKLRMNTQHKTREGATETSLQIPTIPTPQASGDGPTRARRCASPNELQGSRHPVSVASQPVAQRRWVHVSLAVACDPLKGFQPHRSLWTSVRITRQRCLDQVSG